MYMYATITVTASYTDDDGVPADSSCPTFATAVFHVNNERWFAWYIVIFSLKVWLVFEDCLFGVYNFHTSGMEFLSL